MKLFKFTVGEDERLYPFSDLQEAHDRRTEVDPSYHYLPVRIEEVTVPGYKLHVYPVLPETSLPDPAEVLAENMDEESCRAYLDKHGVKYHPQLGLKRLRETVNKHMEGVA